MSEGLQEHATRAGIDRRLTVDIRDGPEIAPDDGVVGHRHAVGDVEPLGVVAQNGLLIAMPADHELDVVPRVEHHPRGGQEDQYSRRLIASARRYRSPAPCSANRRGSRSAPPRRPAGSRRSHATGTRSRATRSWARSGPAATNPRHQRRLSLKPRSSVPKLDTIWMYGSPALSHNDSATWIHIVVNDMDQVGAVEHAVGPEPARSEGSQPPIAQSRAIPRLGGHPCRSRPLARQRTCSCNPRFSKRLSSGASGQLAVVPVNRAGKQQDFQHVRLSMIPSRAGARARRGVP